MEPAAGRGIGKKLGFYLVKLPFILVTIIIGFLMEFLLELPFMVMCKLDRIPATKNQAGPHKPGGSRL